MGSSSCPLDNNYHLLLSHAPLVFSTRYHDKQGLLLLLSISIPFVVLGRLLFSPSASMTNGVLLSSSRESFLFVVLTRASLSPRALAQQTGSSYFPLKNNSRSLWFHAPLFMSARNHGKWCLFLVLSIIIHVSRACTHIPFSLQASKTNGVFLSSS